MVYYDDSGRRIYRRVKRRTPATEGDAADGRQHTRQGEAEHTRPAPAEYDASGIPKKED